MSRRRSSSTRICSNSNFFRKKKHKNSSLEEILFRYFGWLDEVYQLVYLTGCFTKQMMSIVTSEGLKFLGGTMLLFALASKHFVP